MRPKRKKAKMTEGSDDEYSVDDWKKKIKNIINPEDRLEHFWSFESYIAVQANPYFSLLLNGETEY